MSDATILLVEDAGDLRRALQAVLARAGHEVVTAGTGRDGLRSFHECRPDLVVLDIGLPDVDGWQVLERIRDVSDVPLIILSGHVLETDRVRGLHGGADDYVVKPFGQGELLARIDALLRRHPVARHDERFDDGVVVIDFARRSVHVAGEPVELTPIEFRLLAALARHAGKVLSPTQLLALVWNDPTGVSPDRVKFAVLRLRRKLQCAPEPSRIETVRGHGYRYARGDRRLTRTSDATA